MEARALLTGGYTQVNLLSDVPGLARFTDANLVNPWGISVSPSGPFWLANNASCSSTLSQSDGQSFPSDTPLVVAMPESPFHPGEAASPTGVVFNGGSGFGVSENGTSGASVYLFAHGEGQIAGWSPAVDLTHALVAVDSSATPGDGIIYTGITIAAGSQGPQLYAANFRAGTIDIFDQNFKPIHRLGAFTDASLPAGFAPFNVQAIGTSVYVTYTDKVAGRYDQGTGPGVGYVDVFDSQGDLLHRLVSQGPLNAPWGLALAPSDFGDFSNALLVGNFGDGRINAFDPQSGAFLGPAADAAGNPVTIPGLWGLTFGNDGLGGASDTLYFTAGIVHEQHGLLGSLHVATADSGSDASSDGQRSTFDLLNGSPRDRVDNGGDVYPLPPSEGPSLRAAVLPPEQLPTALVSVGDAPFALAPTLLSSGGNSSPAAPPAPNTNQGWEMALALAGSTLTAPALRTSEGNFDRGVLPGQAVALHAGQDSSGRQAGSEGTHGVNTTAASLSGASTVALAWGGLDREGDGSAEQGLASGQRLVLAIDVSPQSGDRVSEDSRQMIPWTSSDPGTVRDAATQTVEIMSPPEFRAAPPAALEELALLGPDVPASDFLRNPYGLMVISLTACGVYYSWGRQHLPGAETVRRIKSLWSHSTRRPARTALDVRSADPGKTRVIPVL